ncbi:hypothetical protein NX059_012275 [Plenodomus lindquistii]|nr:hypothetical protein NX059_012275 [Plenodomus lindquistii]
MLHENVLQAARIRELEEQLAEMTKRKGRKRKRIHQGGNLEYGAGSQAATASTAAPALSKRARGGGGQAPAQPGVRRCGNCGGTGHNARTCQKGSESTSESDASSIAVESDVDSNDNDD